MMHVQKRGAKWSVRWRDEGSSRWRSATGFPSRAEALAAGKRLADGNVLWDPHAVRRIDDEGEYYVGVYCGPDGQRRETDEFYTEQDALDEAHDLAEEARAGGTGK